MNLRNKHILITQLRLHDYAGSEIVTLELAEELSRRGARISVVTASHGNPIKDDFERIKNVTLYTLNDPEFDEAFLKDPVELAWIHHQMIPDIILDHRNKINFVFHHMSPLDGPEIPLFPALEQKLADKILVNSKETYDVYLSNNLLEKDDPRNEVFNNPAPDIFLNNNQQQNDKLSKVTVVSNHPPEELLEASNILREKHKIEVNIRGSLDEENSSRVTPEDIFKTDLVVSIGKTIQYAILADKPAYCYDYFGGPGYLNKKNFQKSEDYNFSGRGTSKKSADEIAEEIIGEYNKSSKFVLWMRGRKDKFRLDKRLDAVLDSVEDNRVDKKEEITKAELYSYKVIKNLLFPRFEGSQHKLNRLNNTLLKKEIINIELNKKVNYLESQVSALEKNINEIKRSKSFLIGDFLLKAPRSLRRVMNRKQDDIR